MIRAMRVSLAGAIVCLTIPVLAAQPDRHGLLDRILDTYVRDGLVYYRALQIERAPLDRYIGTLDAPSADVAGWSPAERQAFWINAYNALVLRTVINAYPIQARTDEFPANSVRQIPGGFTDVRHSIGGRLITLDEIEGLLLEEFGDARLSLALGRGAIDSGRLRSEAYTAAKLEQQLAEMVKECATRVTCVRIDPARDVLEVSPLIGWQEPAFVRTFARDGETWASRGAIERAVAGMVYPHMFQREQQVLDRNTFRMTYGDFDWRLNDLGGRSPFPQLDPNGGQRSEGQMPKAALSPFAPNLWKRAPSP
jgi:hypothetical protein